MHLSLLDDQWVYVQELVRHRWQQLQCLLIEVVMLALGKFLPPLFAARQGHLVKQGCLAGLKVAQTFDHVERAPVMLLCQKWNHGLELDSFQFPMDKLLLCRNFHLTLLGLLGIYLFLLWKLSFNTVYFETKTFIGVRDLLDFVVGVEHWELVDSWHWVESGLWFPLFESVLRCVLVHLQKVFPHKVRGFA